MGKLGLRYPPANSVDRDAHAARVALLAEDCADLPEDWLDEAARKWAKAQPFFPRTCELREAAIAYGQHLNRSRALPAPTEPSGPPPKRHIAERDRRDFIAEDWAELNEWLGKQGAGARYQPDGTRYLVDQT